MTDKDPTSSGSSNTGKGRKYAQTLRLPSRHKDKDSKEDFSSSVDIQLGTTPPSTSTLTNSNPSNTSPSISPTASLSDVTSGSTQGNLFHS